MKAKEMGDILTNIEEYAKKCGFNVLVDINSIVKESLNLSNRAIKGIKKYKTK